MVKIGDRIQTTKGIGYITKILMGIDDRHIIIYEIPRRTYSLIEGDDKFKIVKNEEEHL